MAHAYFHDGFDRVSAGETLVVDGEEARHAIKVARLRVGERVTLLNGRGTRVSVEVVTVGAAEFTVQALTDSVTEVPPRPRLVMVQALAKGGRDEMALQAAVEIGVDAVIPWQAKRSVTRWVGAKVEKQHERWRAIAKSASKQSLRTTVPEVLPLASSAALAAQLSQGTWFVLDPDAQARFGDIDQNALGEEVGVVIGPEGGITEDELRQFVQAGAQRVRLGDNVLRTSTAGPAALASLCTTLGRW